jgi:hypothetical protein
MRTQTVAVFTFDELDADAKERAREDYRRGGDLWHWSGEWWASAEAFSAIAPIQVQAIDWDRAEPEMRFADDDVAALSGVRAWKWLHNNGWFDLAARNADGGCTLTGYCGDCDFFDPIHALRSRPADVPALEDLFRDCVYGWAFAARRDLEWCYSDEAIDETLTANGYEYLASGEFWG